MNGRITLQQIAQWFQQIAQPFKAFGIAIFTICLALIIVATMAKTFGHVLPMIPTVSFQDLGWLCGAHWALTR